MGLSIGNIATIASALNSKINVSSLMSGINTANVTADNIGGIKSTIESKLNGISSNITSEIASSISEGDIEKMVKDVDVESKVKSLMDNAGLNNSIDTSQINSTVETMLKEFRLSNINTM